ncbi:MAG: S-layer protein domain-containing protein, partial [Candidatus Methanoperedens sp.]|nr:S-layer protein domain-containing protein [Candidatus Methanoperedens sp.]
MVMKRYIKGIILVLLMLSAALIAMAAPLSLISGTVSPPSGDTTTTFTFTVTFKDDANGTADYVKLTLDGIDHAMNPMDSLDVNTADGKTYTISGIGPLSNATHNYNFTAKNGTDVISSIDASFIVNAIPASPPSITSFNPPLTWTSYLGGLQAFNVTADQIVDVSWTIDGVVVPLSNLSVPIGTKAEYSNNTAGIGVVHTVIANASNSNGSAVKTWTWTVTQAPDTTAPANVTNLMITGNGTTWLLINWTNPTDPDFHHVAIFKNGSWIGNTSISTTNSYNITGLNSFTTYEILVKTVDATGNVNETGTSLIATTDPNTPASASQVTVTISTNSSVTFASVSAPGNTLETVDSSHSLPTGYTSVSNNYFNISTTATVASPITVSLKYNPALLPSGFIESDIRLYHWNDSTNKWDNVTTAVNTGNDMVSGTVSSLSPFVAAVSPKPVITKVDPTGVNVETIGTVSQTFKITVSQDANVTWYIGSSQANNTGLVLAGVQTLFTNTPSSSANYNVSVIATNANGSGSTYWNWTVHSKTYLAGNRVWDGSRPDLFSLKYTWNPMSFSGFYYDINSDVGNESITMQMNSYTDRRINAGNIVYDTTPEEVQFGYSGFGSYQVIGFMADKYFAGYTSNTTIANAQPSTTFAGKSALAQGQLHKVLMDEDLKRTISVGSTLPLQEGYVLKAVDIDLSARTMLISLLKDGNVVDPGTPLN